jgi:uroporphyrin-III C-methyltransferase
VAVIQNASLPRQRHAIARLDELVAVVAQEKLGSPSVLVVGEVVRCARSFAQWMQSAQLQQARA